MGDGSSINSSNLKFEPNVLQVYAAYHSGLANGTSVKLNVTHATTAREVVDLVSLITKNFLNCLQNKLL